jgi:hypothetical protein
MAFLLSPHRFSPSIIRPARLEIHRRLFVADPPGRRTRNSKSRSPQKERLSESIQSTSEPCPREESAFLSRAGPRVSPCLARIYFLGSGSQDFPRVGRQRDVRSWHRAERAKEPTNCRLAEVKLTLHDKRKISAVDPTPDIGGERQLALSSLHPTRVVPSSPPTSCRAPLRRGGCLSINRGLHIFYGSYRHRVGARVLGLRIKVGHRTPHG